ncbi:glycerophosphoryl diester phosphodiesterase [Ereboglobus sp. PH5-10]|uniref:glycerophosphodiester phosphodiesterase n=1 Tax=Ereboglobus sp. PH5-10 TaxID=2940629 RepID=UPI0024065BA9|nr:glycerophosphodiester phosphodiesterase [Ereboglobus sp. PH5-10]MDF9826153.1 glycerophosphoryl diester phosphodiesterase [Ereboglobus sp. PH5-10]
MKTRTASALVVAALVTFPFLSGCASKDNTQSAASAPGAPVGIVAHRGASYDAPENTIAAQKLAWEQGADAVETDIYLTKDGKIIALHDKTTNRTTGKKLTPSKSTLAELRALDAGSWKSSKYAGEKIPTLDEQLALIPSGKRMFIEIKVGPEIVPELVRCLAKAGAGKHNITFISFNYDALKAAHEALPEIPAQYLKGYRDPAKRKPGYVQPTIDEVIKEAKTANFTGLDLQATWPLSKADVKRIKDAGLELHVWTVDDPTLGRHWVELGTMSITTNRPAYLRKELKL